MHVIETSQMKVTINKKMQINVFKKDAGKDVSIISPGGEQHYIAVNGIDIKGFIIYESETGLLDHDALGDGGGGKCNPRMGRVRAQASSSAGLFDRRDSQARPLLGLVTQGIYAGGTIIQNE